MSGLKDIFVGLSKVVGQAESNLAGKITDLAHGEASSNVVRPNSITQTAKTQNAIAGHDPTAVDSDIYGGESPGDLSTEQLLALQYDVQRFSIFNSMTTTTMDSVAGAYQSVTGNLDFR